jgi:hypothetical protein
VLKCLMRKPGEFNGLSHCVGAHARGVRPPKGITFPKRGRVPTGMGITFPGRGRASLPGKRCLAYPPVGRSVPAVPNMSMR